MMQVTQKYSLRLKCIGLVVVLVLTQGWPYRTLAASKCDYIAIAQKATLKAYPDYKFKRPAAMHDHGTFVVVDYPLPEGWVGGSPVVRIEKGTCHVMSITRTQ
jgi:hypothetical protein